MNVCTVIELGVESKWEQLSDRSVMRQLRIVVIRDLATHCKSLARFLESEDGRLNESDALLPF